MDVNITLPRPLAWQSEVAASKAKRKVIACGRRVGKTTFDEIIGIPEFLSGGVVVYACPKQKQTNKYWREVKKVLKPLISAGYIIKSEVFRSLEFGDGRMEVQTAHNADSIRGDRATLLILDEWQDMDANTWNEVGVPMLLDDDGTAVFTFTPKRKNHAYMTYMRGLSDDTGRWQSWNFSSFSNHKLSEAALEEIIQDMTEDAYKQEILAEFLENEGAVFRNVGAAHTAPPTRPNEHAGHFLVAGIDWGKRQDYTVISIVCADCHQEVSLTRFNKIDYTYQRERLTMDIRNWNVTAGLAELNAMGEPNLELLQQDFMYPNAHIILVYDTEKGYVALYEQGREFDPNRDFYGPFGNKGNIRLPHVPYDPATCRYGKVLEWQGIPFGRELDRLWNEGESENGLPISGFWTTGSSKPPLIENLVRVVEKQEYTFLPHAIAQAEMEAYEIKINPQTNRPSYSAPDGVNDDTVIARGLAIWQAMRHIPAAL